jgi:hypothetical protein
MFTYPFWRAATERAVKSFAQSLLAVLGVGGLGLLNVDWLTALSTAGMATLLSVLTSIASESVGPQGDPSVVPSVVPAQQPAPPETQPSAQSPLPA